jgi:hypothetical protein
MKQTRLMQSTKSSGVALPDLAGPKTGTCGSHRLTVSRLALILSRVRSVR